VISLMKLSPNKAHSKVGALALVVLVALVASGCGRRGPLEPPPDPSAKSGDAHEAGIHRKAPPITPPKDPFILDPLL
jgi:predicted small lipoprotein YifL